ncbi:MAG: deoxyribonuclease IV [Phycisphaerales bacterium]|nr:deoxyribonuclease IV [Phycisphaerales bacterium]
MRIGSHRSAAGGVANAILEAVALGLDCVQLFTANQRQWKPRQPSQQECSAWFAALKTAGWSKPKNNHVVSHNSYLVNLASPDAQARKKSIGLQRSELERCEMLGIGLCVMHPGAHLGDKRSPKDKNNLEAQPNLGELAGIKRLVESLNQLHKDLPGYKVLMCLENTVGAGTTLGYNFNQLAMTRALVGHPDRIAFCIDTCHAVAAGYNMGTITGANQTLKLIDQHLKFEQIRVIHVNDSQFPCGSRKDRHAHIFDGACGSTCFGAVTKVAEWKNIPMILETPKEGLFQGRNWDVVNAERVLGAANLKFGLKSPKKKTVGAQTPKNPALVLLLVTTLLVFNTACKTRTLDQIRGDTPIDNQPLFSDTTVPNVKETAQLSHAGQLIESGDYDSALATFQEILQENPKLPEAWVGVGQVQALKNDWTQSESAYLNATNLDLNNFDAQFGRGKALQVLNQLVDAIRAYHRALLIRPEDFDTNLNMATAYLQLDEGQSAVVFAEKSVKLKPDSGIARLNLGVAYELSGKPELAISQYEIAAELMEPTPQLLRNLLNAYAQSKRYREAVNAALLLVKLAPNANSYERLGWAYFRVGDYEKSLSSYREAVRIDPKHWPSWNGIGVNLLNAWINSGKKDVNLRGNAKSAFERSLQQNPEQPKVAKLIKAYKL